MGKAAPDQSRLHSILYPCELSAQAWEEKEGPVHSAVEPWQWAGENTDSVFLLMVFCDHFVVTVSKQIFL